jgi:16S rRNA U516 pseudouridylate synthase RsuA-like enzyme
MERIGYPVIKLVRIRMGPLNLEMVENGRYIELLDRDIAKFFPSRK